jgi:cell division protein FtsA
LVPTLRIGTLLSDQLKDESRIMSKQRQNGTVIAGLDIGSTKVTVTIGLVYLDSVSQKRELEIVGVGTSVNTGIRQGIVVNIESTTDAIKKAKEEAELMSGYSISEAWIAISGSHVRSFDSKGMVAVKTREVTKSDIDRVIEAATAVAVPGDRTVLHVIPRDFKVDDHEGISDPIGMTGVRLESNVHIVTGSQTALSNIYKCSEKAGIKIAGSVLESLAGALAVLSEDEKNLGVCLVDIGGGTCSLIYYVRGSVAHTSVIPVGGQHVTNDVAVGLRTTHPAAEELKRKFGCALSSLVDEAATVEVEGLGGRKNRTVLKKDLAEVIEPRAEEMMQMILTDLKLSGLGGHLGSGLVLTGGASQMEGLIEMGEFIFDIPVRRGIPQKSNGLTDLVKSSAYATGVGLLHFGMPLVKIQNSKTDSDFWSQSIENVSTKVKSLFGDLF